MTTGVPPFPGTGQAAAIKPIRLDTPRFLVRSLTPHDANDRWLAWAADPDVMEPLNVPARTMAIADLQRYIASFDQTHRFLVGIYARSSGHQIGFYMIDTDPTHRIADFNVVIGDKAFWGQGAVNEVRAALLDHFFTRRGIEKAVGRPLARNFPAVFNYRAQGWRLEGILKAHRCAHDSDRRLDQYEFGLTKAEWIDLKQKSGIDEHA